uniref:Uncharacterized protein n=1 Tax=Triticum urartu TaxID=4572 RepID=A0A8R7JX62_TRIUA
DSGLWLLGEHTFCPYCPVIAWSKDGCAYTCVSALSAITKVDVRANVVAAGCSPRRGYAAGARSNKGEVDTKQVRRCV